MTVRLLLGSIVVFGAVCIVVSFFMARSVKREVPREMTVKWNIVTMLMLFFVPGYIVFSIVVMNSYTLPMEVLTSIVFFAGACFVLMVVNIFRETISKIKDHEVSINKINDNLKKNNLNLTQEIIKRQEAEDTIININKVLESKIEERTSDLVSSNKRLQEEIDNRKAIEADMRKSQDLFVKEHEELNMVFTQVEYAKKEWEKTMDCLGDCIIRTDADGKIRRINTTAATFAGRDYNDILNHGWEEIFLTDDIEATAIYSGCTELYQKSTGNWFELHTYPFYDVDHQHTGEVITIHNTTETKKIRAELERANREIDTRRMHLKNALDEVSALIQNVTKHTGLQVRFHNPNLRTCYHIKKCGKKDCPCFGQNEVRCWQVAGTFCGGKVQGEFAQKYNNCTQCEVYQEATTDPIYQIGEQFNNMMHVLALKSTELEDALQELKQTQSQMLQGEKMASIGQLAAGVAHEINNPMGFIGSNIGTLKRYMDKLADFITVQNEALESLQTPDVSERVQKSRNKLKVDYVLEDIGQLVEESLEGVDRVKKIVQNLKSFSRVDQAEHTMSDINECIESTLNIVWNELKYKSEVHKEYGEIPLTKCYPQQLNQVFMNLLVNAAQAIEEQGEIRIKTSEGDGYVNVSISDTGAGIPENRLDKIFEPFYTTKPVGKGTGLGLSITYDIIKKHNGELHVESEVGKGTIFNLKIPVVEGIENG